MKKFKLLSSLVLPTTLVPLTSVTSCAKTEINQAICESAVEYIKEIGKIPHVSNDDEHLNSLQAMNEYLRNTAKQFVNENTVQTDDVGNVWFDIPASSGCNHYQKLALQGHMDMVWAAQGEAASWDKWTHAPAPIIEEVIDGKRMLHSQDYLTNIGTDDSCGMAYMLAIAKHHKDFKHGIIRCIFTTNEENGQPGAEVLGKRRNKGDVNVLNHEDGFDYLINLDSGPVGSVVFNAAGGYVSDFVAKEIATPSVSGSKYHVEITKCLGGHSGQNIGDGRVNAIKLAAKMIKTLNDLGITLYISSFSTPNAFDTSIPTGVSFDFVSNDDATIIKETIRNVFNAAKETFKDVEKDMDLVLNDPVTVESIVCLTSSFTKDFFAFINDDEKIQYGAIERYTEPDEHNAIKCSANVCPLTIDPTAQAGQNKIRLHFTGRYQENEDLDKYVKKYDDMFKPISEDFNLIFSSGHWSPWDGNKHSKLCDMCIDSYNNIGIEGVRSRVHGGLECVDLLNFNDKLVEVSLGPTNIDEHSVFERLDVDSYLHFIKMMEQVCLKMEF